MILKESMLYVISNNYSDKKHFRIDFYFPRLNLFVEFNGTQHFKPVRFNNMTKEKSEENFIKQQKRDQFIRDYCKTNNINLLEIDGRKYKGNKLIKYVESYLLECQWNQMSEFFSE